jgi:hypothetical protein
MFFRAGSKADIGSFKSWMILYVKILVVENCYFSFKFSA